MPPSETSQQHQHHQQSASPLRREPTAAVLSSQHAEERITASAGRPGISLPAPDITSRKGKRGRLGQTLLVAQYSPLGFLTNRGAAAQSNVSFHVNPFLPRAFLGTEARNIHYPGFQLHFFDASATAKTNLKRRPATRVSRATGGTAAADGGPVQRCPSSAAWRRGPPHWEWRVLTKDPRRGAGNCRIQPEQTVRGAYIMENSRARATNNTSTDENIGGSDYLT
ncbi:hypothetical protein CCHR01_13051 [Colletotrichum chrysophilum]|uniref:Uncharacterized protein n=1 Tax=Colletotrichum chrysophilum TaxID=1836956 RepID=A0AAD9EGW5_9PEZI|nr:hypothetical protein CCHR01_13051 [Colletotrichum chrysophilum]